MAEPMPTTTKAFMWLVAGCLLVVVAWSVMHTQRRDAVAGLSEGRPTGLRVDVNHDDAAMLELLPGVGPSIARNIVEAREGGAVFGEVEELDAVRYVGPSVVDRVRPWVVCGGVVLE